MDASDANLVTLAYCDLGAVVRGRSMLTTELEQDRHATVGWVPSAIMRPPFGPSVKPNPFGATGDLRLRPDLSARVRLPGDDRSSTLDLVLCDLVEADGEPWDCCPRTFLRAALDQLHSELGARVRVSFEHEFQLLLDLPAPAPMSLEAHRLVDPFPVVVMSALQASGLAPERFLPEGGPHQFEITVAPTDGLAAADRSVLLQAVIREAARRHGVRASFSALVDPAEAGNGVHLHLSLCDAGGKPLFHDPAQPADLSVLGHQFAAGILAHAGALAAITAPSPVSQARLQPGRRSAGMAFLGLRNREALLRIPPVLTFGRVAPESQMRLEYRGADAAANPYLMLGTLIHAGLDGIRRRLPAPPIIDRDPSTISEQERHDLGVTALPTTLAEALEAIDDDAAMRSWLPPRLCEAYLAVKTAEVLDATNQDLTTLCKRYALLY
jgi:glutamine synthetase